MDKKDIDLEKYGISKHRYRELKAFCMQYQEWKEFLKNNNDTVKSLEITDMPLCHGNSDQTCSLATKRAELSKNIEMIEKCAEKSSIEFKNNLIQNVCNGTSVERMIDIDRIPISKNVFYNYRRIFFINLDKVKK